MALYIETDEEKAKREYDQKWLKAEIELAILDIKYGIPFIRR